MSSQAKVRREVENGQNEGEREGGGEEQRERGESGVEIKVWFSSSLVFH